MTAGFTRPGRRSSFNNKAYLMSVRETRKVSLERDGSTQASRWCAGCHDPVPFFSGEFDDPNFDDVHNPTGQAGITCTVCHVITTVNNTRGNSAYTIEEPQHYPFAFSEDPILKWVNLTLVKAKPEMHKKTFLKPIVKSTEFCSVCHKVGLPFAVNHYKDFVRGQDHYNSYLLSGVSGHGREASITRRWRSQTATSATWTCWPRTTSGPGTSMARAHGRFTTTSFPEPIRLCQRSRETTQPPRRMPSSSSLFLTVYSSIFLQNRGLRNHRGGVAPGAVSPPGADGSTC